MIELTTQQLELREQVRAFADDEVAPVAAALYERGEYPVELVHRMGELGIIGLPFPQEYGGRGLGLVELCLAIEEVGRVDQSLGITLESAVSLGAMPILQFGTAEQRERWLPALVAGEQVAGFGLTEPSGGTDTASLRTRAEPDGDQWVISGEKAWIGNAGSPLTSHVTITAATGDDEVTNFVVPAGTPGFTSRERNTLVGWRTIDNRHLDFTDCRVPDDHRLGDRGAGLANFLTILDAGRVAIAALAVGLIQGCLDACTAYAKQRHAFDRPIGSFQAVAFAVADLAASAQVCRDAWMRAAWLHDQERPFTMEAAIAKLRCSEEAVTAARTATQVFGGLGFSQDSAVGRFYMDAKILEIGEGTSEVQRLVIAQGLGLPIRPDGTVPS